MTQIVAPSTSFEATLELGTSGLVGTLELGIYDGDTATQALSTANINEISSSGVYVATRTSPGTAGQYVLIWSQDGTLDPDQVITEDLTVTTDAPAAVGGTSNLYVSAAELKSWLSITSSSHDDEVDLVVSAASRAIDDHQNTRYYPTSETRYYEPSPRDSWLIIDDLVTLTSVKFDIDGDGTFETTLTENTHFTLEPLNNALENKPKYILNLIPSGGYTFPGIPRSVQVVGSFGWASTPAQVKYACMIQAARYYSRRSSPFGIAALSADGGGMRLGKLDPDVAAILQNVDGTPARLIA